jgi:alpha/beta superfamily hydrolase
MIARAGETCEEHVAISVGTADLSGVLAYPSAGEVTLGAVIAGPHPLLGGNLRSNVVRSLRQALAEAGCAALTFDYRALDQMGSKSRDWSAITAEFWRDSRCEEEHFWVEEFRWAARALADWCGPLPVVLVGYSFGCWVVAQHAAVLDAAAVILVSPNPRRHDFSGLGSVRAPLLVIQSDGDFTCGLHEGEQWFHTLREPKQRRVLPTSGHFFRGREGELAASAVGFLRARGVLREPTC